jgi:GntR family transcriptional regulator, arabinose operon transcriptional repressor
MSITKYERLKYDIKDKITENLLQEGDKIPTQSELEEIYNVSRITVKKAVSDLINENILEHIPGKKGLFIKKQTKIAGSRTIAVAIDNVTDRFGATILRGIEDYLWEKKYHTIICNADRDFEKVEEYFHSFDYGKVDGIIFSPVIDQGYGDRNGKIIQLLKDKAISHVLVDRFIPGVQSSYVISDDLESSRLMTHSLIRAGHSRILVGMGLECSSMIRRVKGIRQAFLENNLEFDENLLIKVNDNLLSPDTNPAELKAMEDQINRAGGFTAFYAQNDRLLNAGLDSMLELGMDVSSVQLALHNEVSKPKPPFTDHIPRVIPPVYRMGWKAAQLLLNNIHDGDNAVSQIIIKNEIFYENLKQ